MAKIIRATQKIFAEDSPTLDVMQFGSLAAFNPVPTKDVKTLQALPAFTQGWRDAVRAGSSPTMEDFNALFLLATQQIAYILQEGVAEWDEDTVYYKGSIVKGDIYGTLYYCAEDDTQGIPVSNPAYWAVAGQGQSPLFVGACIWDAGDTAPLGFGDLDGGVLLIEDYPALYGRIGDSWATCLNMETGLAWDEPSVGYFRKPDLRGVSPRNIGELWDGVSIDFSVFLDDATAKNGLVNSSSTVTGTATQGATAALGGNHTHTNSGTAVQGSTATTGGPHVHNVNPITYVATAPGSGAGDGIYRSNSAARELLITSSNGNHSHTLSGSTGGGGAHSHALSATAAAQTITSTDVETRGKSVGMHLRIKLF